MDEINHFNILFLLFFTIMENKEKNMTPAEIIYKKDGDQICAMVKGKENLAEDPAGFGATEDEAKANLFQEIHKLNQKPYGVKIIVCAIIDEMPHELATAELRSSTPFTKQAIEKFIETDDFIATIKKGVEDDKLEVKTFYVICNK